MTGQNYWLIIRPVVFFLALAAWISLLLLAGSRKRSHRHEEIEKKGPVSGAIIEGSPAQLNPGYVDELAEIKEDED